MARLPRLALAGQVHHVFQHGIDGKLIFHNDDAYTQFLQLMHDHAQKCAVAVHAYVLLPNCFHLLASPETANGLSLMMQSVGRSYVRWFNDVHQRKGSLWQGRYKSTVLEAGDYLISSMVDLDLLPVRDGLVAHAADYVWSSHQHYVGKKTNNKITPHALIWNLGNTPFAREEKYAQLVSAGVSVAEHAKLTDAVMHGWILGGAEFTRTLQARTPRRLIKANAGRPIKQA